MDIYCRHGAGLVVLTYDGVLLYVVDGRICSSDIRLSPNDRSSLEERLRVTPQQMGRITTHQIQASLRVPYDEDAHPDDGSLGTDDSWSDVQDETDDDD